MTAAILKYIVSVREDINNGYHNENPHEQPLWMPSSNIRLLKENNLASAEFKMSPNW